MEITKERIERRAGGQEKHSDGTFASGAQIDDMFRKAEAAESEKESEKDAGKAPSIPADGPVEFGDGAVYPEECCDATEISDEDYERWNEGSEKGFWQTFIKNR